MTVDAGMRRMRERLARGPVAWGTLSEFGRDVVMALIERGEAVRDGRWVRRVG